MSEVAPRVSIGLPVYNKQECLGETIACALAQSFEDFELILINDCSTDGSEQVALSFDDPRIQYYAKKNGGVSAVRNDGVQKSRAALIAFLNADDLWAPDHFARLIDLAEKFPQVALFANAYQRISESGEPLPLLYHADMPEKSGIIGDYLDSTLTRRYPVWTSCAMLQRELLLQTGGLSNRK